MYRRFLAFAVLLLYCAVRVLEIEDWVLFVVLLCLSPDQTGLMALCLSPFFDNLGISIAKETGMCIFATYEGMVFSLLVMNIIKDRSFSSSQIKKYQIIQYSFILLESYEYFSREDRLQCCHHR